MKSQNQPSEAIQKTCECSNSGKCGRREQSSARYVGSPVRREAAREACRDASVGGACESVRQCGCERVEGGGRTARVAEQLAASDSRLL